MKKRIIALILIIVTIVLSSTTIAISAISANSNKMDSDCYYALQRMLFRDIEPVVKEMYGEYARVEISEINVVDIEHLPGKAKLTLVVEPFTGPHNYIGKVEMEVIVELYKTVVTNTKVLELY